MSGPVRLRQFVADADVPEQCPRRHDGGNGPRGCPYTLCRYHRLLPPSRGPTKVPRIAPGDDTCALDVAARGPSSEADVARFFGVRQEAVGKVLRRALVKLATRLPFSLVERESGGKKPA